MNGDICPCCGQSVTRRALGTVGKRICSLCNGRIRKHDKWEFGPDTRPRHKNCSRPDGKSHEQPMALPLHVEHT